MARVLQRVKQILVVGWSIRVLEGNVRFYQTSLGLFSLPCCSHLSKAVDCSFFKLQEEEPETLFHISGISRRWGLGFWLFLSERLSNSFHFGLFCL